MDFSQIQASKTIDSYEVVNKGEDQIILPSDGGVLQLEEQYCGDHSLWFICSINADGVEMFRHNIRYIKSINFEQ